MFDKIKAGIGDYIMPDGWRGYGSTLEEGVHHKDSPWPGCSFYLPSAQYENVGSAVIIKVTGRTIRYFKEGPWIRVRIEWVGDGEPSNFDGGFMYIGPELFNQIGEVERSNEKNI